MNKKQKKIFYPLIFLAGITLIIWEIEIYRNTIINIAIPIGIILIVGILAFFIDFKNFKKTYKYSGFSLYLYSLMHYFLGFGFIACAFFMLTNFYLADEVIKTETYQIIDRHELVGGSGRKKKPQPAFIINYKGKEKELVFYNKYLDKLNFYKTIELDIRKGYFGFDILENKRLK